MKLINDLHPTKTTAERHARKAPGVPLFEVFVSVAPGKTFVNRRRAMIEAGTLRKLAPKLYTANMVDSAESITRRNLFFILEHLFPQAVISHRSAFEVSSLSRTFSRHGKVSSKLDFAHLAYRKGSLFEDGNIYLTYNISKTITIPGFTIHLWKGPKADRRDIPMGNLFLSGRERRTLEVLQRTRTRLGEGTTKTIPRASVEAFLKNLLLLHGDQALLDFRDSCQEVAAELGMESEFETLDAIINPIMTMAQSAINQEISEARKAGR